MKFNERILRPKYEVVVRYEANCVFCFLWSKKTIQKKKKKKKQKKKKKLK